MSVPDGFATRSIHAGEAPDPTTGALGIPIYQNATYAFRSYEGLESWRNGAPHFLYAREGNPTVRCLELKMANLEGAEASVGTATGMAAISATLLHLLRGDGHLVASTDLYSVSKSFLTGDLPEFGATVDLVDFTDLVAVESAIGPATRALFTESFSNPLLRVADLSRLGEIARSHNIPLVVDNTFLSPALLRPLEHGADIVVHSATKYISGHGNVLGGFVSGRRDLVSAVSGLISHLGGTMSAFSAWLLLSGVKTLPLRADRHSSNAFALASLLERHPAIERVHYPGLASHPQHRIAQQLVESRFGGMLSFEMRGGDESIGRFLNLLRLPSIAVSLGDTASLIWPIAGTNLIRLSVGLEELVDLEKDFTTALDAIKSNPCLFGSSFNHHV